MSAGVSEISSRAVWTPLCHWLVSFPTVNSLVFPNPRCDLHNLLVFRTFWSIFLVSALTSIPIGSLVVLCACPLSKPTLFKVGGAFQLCGGKAHFLLSHNSAWVFFLGKNKESEQLALTNSTFFCSRYPSSSTGWFQQIFVGVKAS